MWVWIWSAAFLLFVVAEAFTAQLVSIWFIVGSITAFFAALFGAPVWAQLLIFAAVSVLSLFLLRPLVKKKATPRSVPTNADMAVGRVAVVTQEIRNDYAEGRVVLDGQSWSARSYDGRVFLEGERVRVLSIDGVKLIVVSTKEDN